MRIRRLLLAGWLLVGCFAVAAAHAAPAGKLRVGAAVVDVSPTTLPAIINGGFLSATATKISDPLHARALVIDDGTTKVAICVVDSCLMPKDLLDAAKADASKETGIPVDRMLVSATHCHSAPAAMGALGTDVDPNYPPVLRKGIAAAIIAANKNLVPAKVAWGVADANEYTAIRRWIRRPDRMMKDPFGVQNVRAHMHPGFQNPDAIGPSGPEDPDLTVLSVQTVDGKPLALMGNFAMHYFGTGVTPVSADYFGRFCSKVAALLKTDEAKPGAVGFVGIMSQGTSGDGWRADYGQPKPTITIDQYADALAKLAVDAVAKAPYRDDVSIAMAQKIIRVKARGPDAARLEGAKKVVAEMNGRLPKNIPEVYAREQVYLAERPEADMVLQAIRIGDFGMTALPNEVYALTGLKLKAQSPLHPTMNVELANDELGYIPPPEQHKLGGYTTWPARSSYPDVDAEPKMVETVLTLLEEVAGKPRVKVVETHGPYARAILESGPRSYWRGGEMVGDVATDSTGGGHAGKYEDGVAFYLPGPESGAFNGEGTVNRSPHYAGGRMKSDAKDLGSTYSVEMWFWNGLADNARPVTGYLFSRGPDGNKDCPGDHLGIGGTSKLGPDAQGRLIFFNGNTSGVALVGKTKLPIRTWHHVVLAREGKKVAVYLDGNPEPEISGEADVTLPSNAGDLFIGGRSDNFSNFEGKIDEVSLYPRALRGEDAQQHFKISGLKAVEAADALKPTKPLSPEESLSKLHVEPGFEIELVAAEPLVQDPIAMAFGPDGKLWVVEMADYPYGADGKMKPMGRVRYLEDSDGDGKYDKSTIFMEGANFPTGVLPWRKGVIITAAPDIIYAEDTDGDGKADVRKVLFTGFTQGNPQLRVNCPTYGLDGWVYIANGLSSKGKVKSLQTGMEVDVSGKDLRIRPDDGAIELETGATEFGRNRSDWNDWFGCDNSRPVWHCVIADRYAKRNPQMGPVKPTDLLGIPLNPQVFPLASEGKRYHSYQHAGHYTSACGTMIYRDELLFPRTESLVGFTCEPVHNLVQRWSLKPSGSTFAATREGDPKFDFVTSEDPWFRPTFTTTGPDGALYVADMYRYMIEHPDWLPQQGRDEYRPFYRLGEDKGRIYRVYPKGKKPAPIARVDQLKTPELVAALESPNGWRRDAAQYQLMWRNEPAAAPMVEKLLASSNALARLHGLATLDALGTLRSEQIATALKDAHPAIRRFAITLAEPRAEKSPVLIAEAAKLAADPDDKVRLQLACTLGNWESPAAGEALAKLAAGKGDSWLSTAILTSAPKHFDQLVKGTLAVPDPLAAPFFPSLIDMAMARNDRESAARLLTPVVTGNHGPKPGQFDALARFLDYLSQHKQTLKQLSEAKKDDLSVKLGAAATLIELARLVATDDSSSAEMRASAIALLGREPAKAKEDVDLLAGLLSPRSAVPVQKAAVAALGRTGNDSVPALLIGKWNTLSPDLRLSTADLMIGREPWAFAMLQEVEAGKINPAEFDAARKQRLIYHASGRVKSLAQKLLASTANPARQSVLDDYRPALSLAGNAKNGAKIFAQNCAVCHKVGEVGNEIGPNLRSVIDWQGEALLTSIMDPSRAFEPRFQGYTATLENGDAAFGIITAETATAITIKGLDAKERTIQRSAIKSLVGTNKSLMPDGLEAQIDKQGLADLLRYIRGGGAEN